MLFKAIAAFILIIGSVMPVLAGPHDDAMAAYGRGDYATAIRVWLSLAEQDDAKAQFNLALMYNDGRGVGRDYVNAHMWMNLASKKGYQGALRYRDLIADRMSPVQLDEALKRASAWRPRVAKADAAQARSGVQLKMDNGIFVVPVQINGTMTLDFVVDSGASDVMVPADVFSTLKRAGSIRDSDVTGQQPYILADGSKSRSTTFTIRSLRVGDVVVENVRGSVGASQGDLLLGQSFLERFKSWSMDNTKHELLLETFGSSQDLATSLTPDAHAIRTPPPNDFEICAKIQAAAISKAKPCLVNGFKRLALNKTESATVIADEFVSQCHTIFLSYRDDNSMSEHCRPFFGKTKQSVDSFFSYARSDILSNIIGVRTD